MAQCALRCFLSQEEAPQIRIFLHPSCPSSQPRSFKVFDFLRNKVKMFGDYRLWMLFNVARLASAHLE
ncbi:hypothetical protein KIN20_024374 [Parelaphostrongylus tenuis]|uniref:Uncharacterized protein n=1 Tax=Parelaphostrongylus tenuis TaxID=148309 RepID=A0AAD5MTC7_PARTN|nr:hypothetical protein KIN20_024374 [Parelaphostrongylus tenuis]